MSAATADRLLRAPRTQSLHGMSTTHAGTLLKQQIPVRTFAQWNETRPGFLEADLVAHCGAQTEGSYLYTLTLTDLATGWTECLPLLSKSAEAVLCALQQERACFPFPILGLDADNGCEFINDPLLTYCEQEHITFTRGREGLKNDQCFVDQKNGAIVRQVIGYDRLEGERAYRQLGEVYQALRLYVNGFQPSMKLQATQYDGRKVRRVYDAAKTPLQRLLLFKVLPASKEQELLRVAQVLDPLRLFHHLQDLQQALFASDTSTSPDAEGTSPVAVFPFCVERCLSGRAPATARILEESWPEQVVHARVPDPVSPVQPEQEADRHVPATAAGTGCSSVTLAQQPEEKRPFPPQQTADEATIRCTVAPSSCLPRGEQLQVSLAPTSSTRSRHIPSTLTIEQAIQDYLKDQRSRHRRPKTIEWHELLACHSARKTDVLAERATMRNRAILWLLFDTGMRVSEVCVLRLSDVDREQGILLIRGKGAQARRLSLGHEGLRHLLTYLDTYRQWAVACRAQRGASDDHLFLSETGRPLSRNGMALLFARLRKRAGIMRRGVNPSLLRESFALRYLQTGGEPFILQELLGYPDQSTSKRYRYLIAQALTRQPWRPKQGLAIFTPGFRPVAHWLALV